MTHLVTAVPEFRNFGIFSGISSTAFPAYPAKHVAVGVARDLRRGVKASGNPMID